MSAWFLLVDAAKTFGDFSNNFWMSCFF